MSNMVHVILKAGLRIALRNRIKTIEEENDKKHQSNIRVVGYLVTFCLGVLVAVAAFYLTKDT